MQTFTQGLRARQQPGRPESMRAVVTGAATELQKRVAGLGKSHGQRLPSPIFGTFTLPAVELTEQERASLPF